MHHFCFPLWALAFVVVSALPGSACFTGLTLIPTAETVGAGAVSIEPQFDSFGSKPGPDARILNTQFGLGERFEAGVDFDWSEDADNRTLLNAKYVFLASTNRMPSMAAGVFNVGRGMRAVPYVACSAEMRGINCHLGGMRTESRNRWFAGVHKPASSSVCLMADYISGAENFSAVGVEYALTQNLAVLVGRQYPNGSGDPSWTLHLIMVVNR